MCSVERGILTLVHIRCFVWDWPVHAEGIVKCREWVRVLVASRGCGRYSVLWGCQRFCWVNRTATSLTFGFFLIKPPPYLPLMPDAHLTHKHEEKGTSLYSNTPAAATSLNSEWPHGHNSRPLWHPATPGNQCRKAQPPRAYITN